MNKDIKDTNKQQGQALLFIVVAMTIALSIGINASVRTITSLSRTARTDTAARALAAAEGGVERFLALSTQQLDEAVNGTCPEDPTHPDPGHPMQRHDESNSCIVSFETVGDILTSEAYVNVKEYDPPDYPFSLISGQVKEVNLYDYTESPPEYYGNSDIRICWNSDPAIGSDIMYTSYDSSGILVRGILTGEDPPVDANYEAGGADTATSDKLGFEDCEDVDIGSDVYGLRIRSLGGPSDVEISGLGGENLPLQGYEITSVGKLQQVSGVTATRIIRVVKTLPYLPSSFDYALYSNSDIVK